MKKSAAAELMNMKKVFFFHFLFSSFFFLPFSRLSVLHLFSFASPPKCFRHFFFLFSCRFDGGNRSNQKKTVPSFTEFIFFFCKTFHFAFLVHPIAFSLFLFFFKSSSISFYPLDWICLFFNFFLFNWLSPNFSRIFFCERFFSRAFILFFIFFFVYFFLFFFCFCSKKGRVSGVSADQWRPTFIISLINWPTGRRLISRAPIETNRFLPVASRFQVEEPKKK